MNEKALEQPASNSSVEEFMTSERPSAVKSEFKDVRSAAGRPGTNRWHNLIVSNLAIALGSRMGGNKAEIYLGSMRVKLKNGQQCYPDVVIVNGEPAFADQNYDLLLNPTIVFEIVSAPGDSSEKTQKLEKFLAMDSIKECVLIKQDEMRIEHYSKQNAKQWIYRIYNERDDVMSLESINTKISLSEVYAQIKMKQAEFSSKAVN